MADSVAKAGFANGKVTSPTLAKAVSKAASVRAKLFGSAEHEASKGARDATFAAPEPPVPTRMERDRRPRASLEETLLKLQGLAVGGMVTIAAFSLTTEVGPLANLRASLLAATAGMVSYGINRFAVEKAAPLAAVGYKTALVAGPFSILATGAALAISTFTGLVLKDVAQLGLEGHGVGLVRYVSARNSDAVLAASVGPGLQVVTTDLKKNHACEVHTSCVSGKRDGGVGPVAKALQIQAGKAEAVARQFEAGLAAGQKHLETLNALLAQYQSVLGRKDLDVWQKQSELSKIQARVEQEASALSAALPVPMLRAYAAELAKGISIPNQPEDAARVNAILAKHADALTSLLASLVRSNPTPPVFPARPGVADTLKYIPEFASIAGIVGVAELMLPITIWLYAYLKLRWQIEQTMPSPRLPTKPIKPEIPLGRRRGRPPGPRP